MKLRKSYLLTNGASIRIAVDGGEGVACLTGELDVANAVQFEQNLTDVVDACLRGALLIDLSQVTFIDSIAIGVLIASSKHARVREVQLEMRPPLGGARLPFELTCLAEHLFEPASASKSIR